MTSFTNLLNRGKRRYVDKYLKKRYFGRCEGCGKLELLIQFSDFKIANNFLLCDNCYNKVIAEIIGGQKK